MRRPGGYIRPCFCPVTHHVEKGLVGADGVQRVPGGFVDVILGAFPDNVPEVCIDQDNLLVRDQRCQVVVHGLAVFAGAVRRIDDGALVDVRLYLCWQLQQVSLVVGRFRVVGCVFGHSIGLMLGVCLMRIPVEREHPFRYIVDTDSMNMNTCSSFTLKVFTRNWNRCSR